MDLAKIIECFSSTREIYLRDKETKTIKEFLKSPDLILHITGSPGTGKTATVRNLLAKRKHLYVNYFSELNIGMRLKKCKECIVIIDEFDKYLEEKKQACLQAIIHLKNCSKKVITISNNLRMGNIRFQPYSYEELVQILTVKMKKEIGRCIMDQKCVSFLAKKHERDGDLRRMFKSILDALSKKSFSKTEESGYLLDVSDFIRNEKQEKHGIHHEIISKIKEEQLNKLLAFKSYINECNEMSILSISKADFDMIFEML